MSLRAALLALALSTVACATVNPSLERADELAGYRFVALEEEGRSADETFVLLTLSGGGTRAAAFAFGVLEAMRDTDLGGGRSLLDELDVISSVSGGSFAAAYLGLFEPAAFFAEFREAVLYRDLQRALLLRVLTPWNWPRLLSPGFSRSDLAVEYYDGAIFRGKRFEDLPRRRPFVVLNATDVAIGARFAFTQEHFDRLCSDMDELPVAFGVVASSAFPIAFAPLRLRNYPKSTCGYRRPRWVDAAQADLDVAPQRWALARTWREYEDPRRAWIHLSDGGIADNIGLRVFDESLMAGDSLHILRNANLGAMRRFVVITVDAMPRGAADAYARARSPGFVRVLEAAASKPMENYSSDTVERVRDFFGSWDSAAADYERVREECDALVAAACSERDTRCQDHLRALCRERFAVAEDDAPPHPRLYRIHVRFDAIPDDGAREALQRTRTSLALSRYEVEQLIHWGRRLVLDSPVRQRLLEEWGHEAFRQQDPRKEPK